MGGGPGGSAAAKRCAGHGLRTALLEKRPLPRNKVCTGMVMSEMAQTLIRQEFGTPPDDALTVPAHLSGFKFRAPGAGTLILPRRMPFAWRSHFDYWLNRVAQGAGVEVREKTKVVSFTEHDDDYELGLDGGVIIRAKYIIGADGTLSTVRNALFPAVPMRYQLNIRLCFRGTLELEPEYVHYFYLPDLNGFDVNFKGDVFLLEITPRPGQGDGAETVRQAESWLTREYGFVPGSKPIWRDGCYEPAMNRRPFAGEFPLGKGNALLVGNAAGLNIPMTGEGIGTAIKSGLLAADAVIKASKGTEKAASCYTPLCREMVADLEGMYPPPGTMRDNAAKGMDHFLEGVRHIYSRSLTIL